LEERLRYADPLGDFSTSEWKISEYINDSNGNPIFVDYDVNNLYMDVSEASFHYDFNQNLDSVVLDRDNWSQDFPHRYIYKYSNSNLSPIEYIEGIPRMNKLYDSIISQQFINNEYMNIQKREYTRDANMNVLEKMHYQWDGSSWLNWRKYISTYDNNNNLLQEFVEEWNGANWVNYSLIDHCEQITGVEEGSNLNNEIFMYPNPTTNLITIQSETVLNNMFKIYDQQGREVMNGKLTGKNTEVSLGKLSRGTYTIQVDGNYKPAVIIKQ
jgi:hypothetical protein